ANGAALTVTPELVLAPSVPAASLAVMVRVPEVLNVKLDKVRVPETKVRLPAVSGVMLGMRDRKSVVEVESVGVALLRMCKFASTALTVTLKAVAAVCAVGVPVLPLVVPGAAVSPGANNCSFTKAAELTVMDELVLAVLVPSVISVAVTVRLPAVLGVMLRV